MRNEQEKENIKEADNKIREALTKKNDSIIFLAKDEEGVAFISYGDRAQLSFLITMAFSQIKKKDSLTFSLALMGLKAMMEGELDL